jgi:hypothetical protein
MLTITVRGWVQRQWHDATKTPLERRLRGIVIGVVELIEEQRHRQAEHPTRESEMEVAQARYQAAVRQRSEEAGRLRGLLRDAVRLERANRIRALASAVEAQATAQGTLDDDIRNWLDWARGKALADTKLLSRLRFSPNFLPSRRRTRDPAVGLDRDPSPSTALSERSGGAGSPCVAEIGVRRPCLPHPAPAHSSDPSAKQASTRSQAAAKIRNSVAFTTGLTWVFSR